jgi:PAS domain S-box-containing protein
VVEDELAVLRRALDLSGIGFTLADARLDDLPLVYVNKSFEAITGYAADEALGRNCRFLQGPDTDPGPVDKLRRAIADERSATVELRNYRKDGTPFWNEVHVAPVRDDHGRIVRFVGVQIDVTAHREEQRLRFAAQDAERRSTFLAEAGPLLDASLDLRATLDSLTRLSIPYLGDACLVYELRHDEVRRLAAAGEPAAEAIPSPTLLRALESGAAEIVTGLGPAQTAMVVPLKARGLIVGVVVFASVGSNRDYGPEELLVAKDLAHRAALALDNARLYENLGEVAHTLQVGLLPQRLPVLDGVDVAARYRPAGDGSLIGGDFYDVLPRKDGNVDLVIGDVTGKGARAAGLTALVRHTLRTAARYEDTPSRVLDVVNRTLMAERTDTGRYCTVAMCRLHLKGTMRATICCAGHPLPMVVRGPGAIDHVGRPGSVLGWVADPKLVDVEFDLDPGQSLVLFTDGVTEARTTGDAYGLGGLEELLRAAAGEDAAAIAARVDRAAAHAGARRDDVAVLVARRGGTSAG